LDLINHAPGNLYLVKTWARSRAWSAWIWTEDGNVMENPDVNKGHLFFLNGFLGISGGIHGQLKHQKKEHLPNIWASIFMKSEHL